MRALAVTGVCSGSRPVLPGSCLRATVVCLSADLGVWWPPGATASKICFGVRAGRGCGRRARSVARPPLSRSGLLLPSGGAGSKIAVGVRAGGSVRRFAACTAAMSFSTLLFGVADAPRPQCAVLRLVPGRCARRDFAFVGLLRTLIGGPLRALPLGRPTHGALCSSSARVRTLALGASRRRTHRAPLPPCARTPRASLRARDAVRRPRAADAGRTSEPPPADLQIPPNLRSRPARRSACRGPPSPDPPCPPNPIARRTPDPRTPSPPTPNPRPTEPANRRTFQSPPNPRSRRTSRARRPRTSVAPQLHRAGGARPPRLGIVDTGRPGRPSPIAQSVRPGEAGGGRTPSRAAARGGWTSDAARLSRAATPPASHDLAHLLGDVEIASRRQRVSTSPRAGLRAHRGRPTAVPRLAGQATPCSVAGGQLAQFVLARWLWAARIDSPAPSCR